jgi:predicted transcriptional regulator
LAGVETAVQANVFADAAFTPDAMRRAVNQQPLLARHLVSLHAALARSQEQLRSLDDALDSGSETPLPWEEVRDWFHASGNYIDTIDRHAEAVAAELANGEDIASAIVERLGRVHGVTVGSAVASDRPLRSFDVGAGVLSVDPSLPSESRLFLLAHQLMRLELTATISATIAGAQLRSDEAFQLLSIGLANYAAGALLMPYAAFRAAARALRHDIDALRLVFAVSFEQACHRLSTLQRPGATGIPFFFCRVDMAGNITKRHSATRLQFARFGGACPLWIVHEAVAIPDRVLVQLAETPDGVRYVSMAKGLVKPSGSYARPSRRYAVALGCEVEYAADFIYGDQLDVTGERSATPIGVSCRICPRRDCEQRAFPPAGRHIFVNPDHRGVVPYTFD